MPSTQWVQRLLQYIYTCQWEKLQTSFPASCGEAIWSMSVLFSMRKPRWAYWAQQQPLYLPFIAAPPQPISSKLNTSRRCCLAKVCCWTTAIQQEETASCKSPLHMILRKMMKMMKMIHTQTNISRMIFVCSEPWWWFWVIIACWPKANYSWDWLLHGNSDWLGALQSTEEEALMSNQLFSTAVWDCSGWKRQRNDALMLLKASVTRTQAHHH